MRLLLRITGLVLFLVISGAAQAQTRPHYEQVIEGLAVGERCPSTILIRDWQDVFTIEEDFEVAIIYNSGTDSYTTELFFGGNLFPLCLGKHFTIEEAQDRLVEWLELNTY